MEVGFIIKKIKEEEIPLLEGVMINALGVWGYAQSELESLKKRLKVTQELLRKSVVCVAKLRNEIAGFWLQEIKSELSESRFYIKQNHMKKGIGSALWHKMIQTLKDEYNLKYITFISDAHAQGFYEKMGAIKIDEIPSDVLIGENVPIMKYNFK